MLVLFQLWECRLLSINKILYLNFLRIFIIELEDWHDSRFVSDNFLNLNKKMKLSIAGCGRIASVHYEAIEQLIQKKNYNVSISALIDISEINAKHFQQKHQIDSNIFTDFEDALNQVEFDSVLICSPHDFHETLAIRSFENGKQVLLEKPMAHDLKSALKILEHSKSSRNVFMIAENSQYWPEVNCVHDLLQKKAIGEIITVRASFRQNTSSDIFDSYNLLPGDQLDKAWRFDKKSSGGGITLDGGAHWIRPMRIWCGDLLRTTAKFGYCLLYTSAAADE